MADNHAVSSKYISKLNEHCQKNQLNLEYKEVDSTGPAHDPVFTLVVVIEGREYAPASANSKKVAKSIAAKSAWDAIQKEMEAYPASSSQQLSLSSPPSQLPLCSPGLPDDTSPNYFVLINELKQKQRLSIVYDMKDKTGEDHKPHFYYTCEIGGKIYGEGTGISVKTAKFNAAKEAYVKFMAQSTSRPEQSAASVNSQDYSEESSRNHMDSGLECSSINGKLANKIGAMQLSEDSSSTAESPRVSAVKSKRKEIPLAPTFSKPHETESKYTTNKRFREDYGEKQKIGGGGYGRVFQTKHAIDQRVCAVKRVKLSFDEEEMAKAKREVETLAKLRHKNIVQYYYCWIGEDNLDSEDSISYNRSSLCQCLFIDMEFCEKGTLKDWLDHKRGTKGCKEDSLMKFHQIVEGVEYIHSEDLIHRDLKPLNIFISKEDKIKIGDFGLVTSGIEDPSVQRTENRGTKIYMAPEQLGSRYGQAVDIFPLGLILFEMLYIFETEYERSKEWANIRRCVFPQIFKEEFPKEADLIEKLLSVNPDKRPSASSILGSLRENTPNSRHTC